MLSIRDPIHGFIRADALESALIRSRPLQRLRFVRQLGWTFLVFPGAEHSRFSHVLGTLHLAGRVYDALAAKSGGRLPADPRCRERRLARAAALLHDVGHAPFSHSAEDLFEDDIDHEEMTCRLLRTPEVREIFAEHGEGLDAEAVIRVLGKSSEESERLLTEIVTSELDVDKMDYLLRDSLYCGVRYGNFDLERLLDTLVPLRDPDAGAWRIGVEHGGVHALEALVMARYYMFTQVYFNVTSKALELHLNEWLAEEGRRWPADPEAFLAEDDLSVVAAMRRSPSPHARALIDRGHYPLAFQTREHLDSGERERLQCLLAELSDRFGPGSLLVSHSAKDPHRFGQSRVLVRRQDGSLEPMEQASHFIGHLRRIDQLRVYAPQALRDEVAAAIRARWE